MNIQRTILSPWPLFIGLSAVVVFGVMVAAMSSHGMPANSVAQVTVSLPPPTSSVIPATGTPLPTDAPTATDIPTPDEQATWDFIATDDAWSQILQITAAYRGSQIPTRAVWSTAFFEGASSQLVKEGYVIENGWRGNVNGTNVSIFAGVNQDNSAQGLLHIFVKIPEHLLEQDYLTPLQAGSVHIVSAENYRLTLLSTDGTTFYFDIPGLQYVDSLIEVVPTLPFVYMTETPSATWTPGPTSTPWPTCTPGPTPTFAPLQPPSTCSG